MQKKPWQNDSCEHVQSYYTIYPVPVAAALWCGVPPGEVQEHLNISTQVHRAVYRHPYVKCLEPRCRAMHEAIEKGALLVSRENGKSFDGSTEQVAADRRHVTRQNLKEWIAREFPSDKPSFLFDEIERTAHSAINADSFRALQAERDAMKTRIDKAVEMYSALRQDRDRIEGERASLAAMVEKMNVPGARSETTYLNIIGGMLSLMLGKSPAGKPQSVFENQSMVIASMLAHHGHLSGISDTTLQNKFAEANRSIKAN